MFKKLVFKGMYRTVVDVNQDCRRLPGERRGEEQEERPEQTEAEAERQGTRREQRREKEDDDRHPEPEVLCMPCKELLREIRD